MIFAHCLLISLSLAANEPPALAPVHRFWPSPTAPPSPASRPAHQARGRPPKILRYRFDLGSSKYLFMYVSAHIYPRCWQFDSIIAVNLLV